MVDVVKSVGHTASHLSHLFFSKVFTLPSTQHPSILHRYIQPPSPVSRVDPAVCYQDICLQALARGCHRRQDHHLRQYQLRHLPHPRSRHISAQMFFLHRSFSWSSTTSAEAISFNAPERASTGKGASRLSGRFMTRTSFSSKITTQERDLERRRLRRPGASPLRLPTSCLSANTTGCQHLSSGRHPQGGRREGSQQ